MLSISGPQDYASVMSAVHAALPPKHDPFLDLVPPTGHQADAEALRLPQDFRRLQSPLHASASFRRCAAISCRGRSTRCCSKPRSWSRAACKELLVVSQDTSAYGVDLKYAERDWRGSAYETRMTGLVRGPRRARRLGATALRLSVSARRRRDPADGGRQAPAVPRHSVPARQPAHPEADEASRRGRQDAGAHPQLARRLPRPHGAQHVHRRISRRNRRRVRGAARFPRRGAARSRRRLRVFAGRRRAAPTRCPIPCRKPSRRSGSRASWNGRRRYRRRNSSARSAACSDASSTRSTATSRSRGRWPTRPRSTAWSRSRTACEAGCFPGRFIDVEILGSDEHDLYGEAVGTG